MSTFPNFLGGGGKNEKEKLSILTGKRKMTCACEFLKVYFFGWWPFQTFRVKQETYKYNLIYFAILILRLSIMLLSMSMSNFLHNVDSQAGPKGCLKDKISLAWPVHTFNERDPFWTTIYWAILLAFKKAPKNHESICSFLWVQEIIIIILAKP